MKKPAPMVAPPVVTPLNAARAAEADAARVLAEATRSKELASHALDAGASALAEFVDAQRVADAGFLANGDDASIEVANKARLRTERARTLHATAAERSDDAKLRMQQAEFALVRASHQVDLILLPRYVDALAPLNDRLIQIDRAIDDLLLDYASTVEAGALAYSDAEHRARTIGGSLQGIARPLLADAILQARKVATAARETEGREDASDLVSTIAYDWKTSDMNASELAQHNRNASRARVTETINTVINAAKGVTP